MQINIDITHEVIRKNSQEWHTQPRATWRERPEFYVQSWGYVVKDLCKKIYSAGIDHQAVVHVFTDEKPAFMPQVLKL